MYACLRIKCHEHVSETSAATVGLAELVGSNVEKSRVLVSTSHSQHHTHMV